MKTIYINDVDYHYEEFGSSDEVILFLHGLGASSSSWHYQTPLFKNNYKILVPDLRGQGQTPLGEQTFSFELCADDLALFLEKLDVKKVHLCGFSLGGMVGAEFAIKYPHMLSSICLVNAIPSFKLNSLKYKIAYQIRRFASRFLPLSFTAFLMSSVLFPKSRKLQKKLKDLVPFINKYGYIEALDAMQDWSVEKEFIKLTIPTLFVGSEFDYKVFDGKKDVVAKMKNSLHVEVTNAHHFVTWECADEFNTIYKKFLTSL